MNRLTKTSEVSKKQLLLAHGALDTKIGDKYSEYDGINLADIAKLVSEPQSKEKADAADEGK